MANSVSPLHYLFKREYGQLNDLKSEFFKKRLNAAKNLYRRDLVCHYGCVNAIEFSNNGELLVSGGDDRRVMLWQFGKTIMDCGVPVNMNAMHHSNIFCLGITSDNQKIYSGGNDDTVIVHDVESRNPLEVLRHQRSVCGLSIDPFNDGVIATAGNDGRLLLFDTRQSVHESLVISRSRKEFNSVMFHPRHVGVLVSGSAREGVELWDLRTPKQPVVRYQGSNGTCQNCMSVRFNAAGTRVLALRRRLSPVLYAVHDPEPIAEFYHQDYYNSCTMKSCCFAGEADQFVVSGSDDFNLYMWKVPDADSEGPEAVVQAPHLVLYGHRSIVNQVRYNPHYCLIASSGVEKIVKVWSTLQYPQMRGALLEEAAGPDNPREIYTHEDYVSLVHHSGQYISHNYTEQSTSEDPRMMAFFDSLVQREQECVAEETDSLDGSSTPPRRRTDTDTDDSDHILVDFVPLALPPLRVASNGNRSQRCPNRLARLVASRYPKNMRSHKRGSLRRNKQSRSSLGKSGGKGVAGASGSGKGKRAAGAGAGAGRARGAGGWRAAAAPHAPHPTAAHSRLSAPSSERDSDEPAHCLYPATDRIIRPLRRRMNLSRATKRKSKVTRFRKVVSIRNMGPWTARSNSENNNFTNFDNFEENLALPSTSTGYRGESSSTLFRIAEVDSDDDQSASSRPISPRSHSAGGQGVPADLVSIVPTPVNGSRDSLGDSLRVEPPPAERDGYSHPSPSHAHAHEGRARASARRARRNGRHNPQRSDSSESPPPKDAVAERLSPPPPGHSRSVLRLMNETNESELESSCSTEGSMWAGAAGSASAAYTASAVGSTSAAGSATAPGSTSAAGSVSAAGSASTAGNARPDHDFKFRQRVKKARRNYRNHMDSDSN